MFLALRTLFESNAEVVFRHAIWRDDRQGFGLGLGASCRRKRHRGAIFGLPQATGIQLVYISCKLSLAVRAASIREQGKRVVQFEQPRATLDIVSNDQSVGIKEGFNESIRPAVWLLHPPAN